MSDNFTTPPKVILPVKKGDHLMVEVEYQKDMDLFQDASVLIQSLYGKGERVINDEFIVVRITPKNENGWKEAVLARIDKIMETIYLEPQIDSYLQERLIKKLEDLSTDVELM